MPMFSRFNITEGNLPWDENPNLRAVLCPISESAIHSAHLKENEDVCHQADTQAVVHPLSPLSDSSGDEESEFISGSNVNKTNRRNPSERIVLVDQSGNRERFTLGTSSSNDLILKHCRDSEEQCYINHVHAQLYPDPDEASLLVFNSSTSIFEAHSLTGSSAVNRTINPSQEALLECGTWQLNFGRGLEFEIKILPYSAFTETHEMTLISPVTPPPIKHIDDVTGVCAAAPKAQGEGLTQEPPPEAPATTKRPVKTSPSGHRKVAVRQEPPVSKKPKNQVVARELIYKAPRTLVYRDIRDGVEVAVKEVRKANGKAAADEWRNEYESLRLLNHESIVKLRASSASKLTLELEYAGQDLATFVDKKRMSRISEAMAWQIWLDISNGLEYMHSQKVVHLDIKPKNILLSTHGRATICDFGLSVRQITDLVKHDGGTPAYVPPEYLREGRRGPPDDIWAFGLVMMFVLGIIPMPFAGSWRIADIVTNADNESAPSGANDKMTAWIGEVQRGKRNIPEKYSLLLRMLDTDPEDRITASELVKSLRAQQTITAPSGMLLA